MKIAYTRKKSKIAMREKIEMKVPFMKYTANYLCRAQEYIKSVKNPFLILGLNNLYHPLAKSLRSIFMSMGTTKGIDLSYTGPPLAVLQDGCTN